jgi:hypothetical protein
LKKAICKKDYVAPKALYNLDGGGSYKSIHDRHRSVAVDAKVGFADMVNIYSKDESRESASHASRTSALSGSS